MALTVSRAASPVALVSSALASASSAAACCACASAAATSVSSSSVRSPLGACFEGSEGDAATAVEAERSAAGTGANKLLTSGGGAFRDAASSASRALT